MPFTSSLSTEKMTTVSEVIEILRERGYSEDFNLLADSLECKGRQFSVNISDFEIDQSYRFEGDTNPSDGAVVYAISSPKHGVKGILVNGYGVYSDPIPGEMAQKLSWQTT